MENQELFNELSVNELEDRLELAGRCICRNTDTDAPAPAPEGPTSA